MDQWAARFRQSRLSAVKEKDTGEENSEPTVTFVKSKDSIENTISAFDNTVAKIQNHEFSTGTDNKKTCRECDMRYYCGKVEKK